MRDAPAVLPTTQEAKHLIEACYKMAQAEAELSEDNVERAIALLAQYSPETLNATLIYAAKNRFWNMKFGEALYPLSYLAKSMPTLVGQMKKTKPVKRFKVKTS